MNKNILIIGVILIAVVVVGMGVLNKDKGDESPELNGDDSEIRQMMSGK